MQAHVTTIFLLWNEFLWLQKQGSIQKEQWNTTMEKAHLQLRNYTNVIDDIQYREESIN